MTRKYLQKIAEMVSCCCPDDRHMLMLELGHFFAEHNSKFDWEKWETACAYGVSNAERGGKK